MMLFLVPSLFDPVNGWLSCSHPIKEELSYYIATSILRILRGTALTHHTGPTCSICFVIRESRAGELYSHSHLLQKLGSDHPELRNSHHVFFA